MVHAPGAGEDARYITKLYMFVIGASFSAIITRFVAMGMFPGNR